MGETAGEPKAVARPKKHLVENETHKIKWTKKKIMHKEVGECRGLTDPETGQITISSVLAPLEEVDTLVHELLHVFFSTGTLRLPDDLEESVCKMIGMKVARHIQDNPAFWHYLINRVENK